MKRGKKLLIMIAVLALAAGGYLFAMKLSEKEAAKQTVAEVNLIDADVTGLKWTKDGETIRLESADGVWKLADYGDSPVDQDTAKALVQAVRDYKAQASVEGNITLSDYGLDEAEYEAEVTTAKGVVTFKQGDANPLTGQTYVSKSDSDSAVYAAEEALSDIFDVSVTDLIKLEELPTIGDVNALSIDGKVSLAKDESGAWRMATGEKCDEIKVEALFDAIREISWVKLVDWTGGTELENPVGLTCAWPDGEFTLSIGQNTDDGYLAKLPDSKMTYAIDAANAEVILAASDESLRSTALFEADWDEEYEISASINGVEYVPGDDAALYLREIETGELAEPAGAEMITVKVNDEECVIRDYDMNNCTATVNGVTRLIPSENADKLIRLIKYAKAEKAEQTDTRQASAAQ